MGACGSRTNADDRLPADPLGRIEGRDGIVEGCDVANVRPQPSVTHPQASPNDFLEEIMWADKPKIPHKVHIRFKQIDREEPTSRRPKPRPEAAE